MFQIDSLSGFWTIKHLTCGASFQITGEKILDLQSVKCCNCGIPIDTPQLKEAVKNLDFCQRAIDRASERFNDPTTQAWQIDPPIIVLEEEEDMAHN